jgi:hypothetical protein
MQIFIKPHIFINEMWGQTIKNLEMLNVQPHVLPNLKFHLPSCFIAFHIVFEPIPIASWLKRITFHAL